MDIKEISSGSNLLEIMKQRYENSSTTITSQFEVGHWHKLIGDPTLADAFLGRFLHNAHELKIKGESRFTWQKNTHNLCYLLAIDFSMISAPSRRKNMRWSTTLSIGLAALTALAISSPNVSARNPARYTNVPFVVGGTCSDGNAAINYVSKNGVFSLQITNADSTSGYGGWEVFTSSPGVNPGNITPSATTSAPLGTYSFTISGLPPSGNFIVVDTVDTLGGQNYSSAIPIANGFNSVTAPASTYTPGNL